MMSEEKKDIKFDMECQDQKEKKRPGMPMLPKALSLEEKKYLLAVERGDMANVRRMLQKAHRKQTINVNCVDPLGRGAISIAIDSENLEMLELLVVMSVETKDALLQAINVGFVEAVELLLEYEELIHKDGEQYSWEKVDWNTGTFSPDITPIILAAHRNNYEIIKILLDRGATLPMPHDVKCGCAECIKDSSDDSLRHSLSRVNEYRALASPSLIALSSNDPILTAFQLSWELRNLAFTEQESKSDYLELRRQCQKFSVDLLQQTRSSQELAIILNHDPNSCPYEDGERMKLARLELAIHMKQKKFVAHPNVQQLLAALWYDGLPGFRRKKTLDKMVEISKVAFLFPFYCMLYMIMPNTTMGKLMRKPFMKFLVHAASYLFFLLILIMVSQNADSMLIEYFGTDSMQKNLEEERLRQRGNRPTALEGLVVLYVLGFIWEEVMELYHGGVEEYLRDLWNVIDFIRNSCYLFCFVMRAAAYIQQRAEIADDPASAYIPREQWSDFDPQLIAEGLFAAANVFSALKLVHLFSINPHLGPLQISLGRMVIDIVKFFFIYTLVLFAFACGLNQLLGYFAQLEKRKCYSLPGGLPDWAGHSDSCTKWRRFGNLFESSQSLFWANFGLVDLNMFELTGIKTYTRFWGLLMFGSYSVINIIVLLNLLIAMMSNSYSQIVEHSDIEWKFARTRLWMSYFEEGSTLPPPFNLFPTPKLIFKMLGIRPKDKLRRMSTRRKERHEKERDYRYTSVMRSLVWRYVCEQHRLAEESPVNEDDINEVKGEITSAKYDLLEVLARNGMDVSSARARDNKAVLGKKMKVWERRLMKDFQVAPVAGEEELDQLMKTPVETEDALTRFRRVARLAVMKSTEYKWGQVLESVCQASQIGRCNNRESFKNQQNLQKAMLEAKKLINHSPAKDSYQAVSPIKTPEIVGGTLQNLLEEIKEETRNYTPTKTPLRMGQNTPNMMLLVSNLQSSATTPLPTTPKLLPPAPNSQKLTPPVPPRSEEANRPCQAVPTISQKVFECTVMESKPEPEPLKPTREETPPKVVKRKAPAPVDQAYLNKENPTIILAPPTPIFNRNPREESLNFDVQSPMMSVRPCADHGKVPPPRKPSTGHSSANSSKSSTMSKPLIGSSSESVNETSPVKIAMPSRSPSPDALRPQVKIPEVNTIKRQPKSGWL